MQNGYIGNLFGIWRVSDDENQALVLAGSHIDTVINMNEDISIIMQQVVYYTLSITKGINSKKVE